MSTLHVMTQCQIWLKLCFKRWEVQACVCVIFTYVVLLLGQQYGYVTSCPWSSKTWTHFLLQNRHTCWPKWVYLCWGKNKMHNIHSMLHSEVIVAESTHIHANWTLQFKRTFETSYTDVYKQLRASPALKYNVNKIFLNIFFRVKRNKMIISQVYFNVNRLWCQYTIENKMLERNTITQHTFIQQFCSRRRSIFKKIMICNLEELP